MIAIYIVLCMLLFSNDNNPLSNFQWKYRIILVSGAESEVNQQLKKYAKSSVGLMERDLVIIYPINNKLHFFPQGKYPDVKANELIKYYKLDDQQFKSLLIGKDGGIKEKNYKIIPATKYFQAIDAMPMRIGEMRRKGG